jgi:hypothetical protein
VRYARFEAKYTVGDHLTNEEDIAKKSSNISVTYLGMYRIFQVFWYTHVDSEDFIWTVRVQPFLAWSQPYGSPMNGRRQVAAAQAPPVHCGCRLLSNQKLTAS